MEPIQITGRHLKITDALRNDVHTKLRKLEKHFPHITRIHITLSTLNVDRRKPKVTRPKIHTAKGLISLPNKPEIVAEKTTDNLYTSIDLLIDVLDEQLKKANGMMKQRRDKITAELRH